MSTPLRIKISLITDRNGQHEWDPGSNPNRQPAWIGYLLKYQFGIGNENPRGIRDGQAMEFTPGRLGEIG
jgi:hypothetical protein